MFQQYCFIKRLMRIIIFVLLVITTLFFVPMQEITNDDKVKISSIITIIFLIYEMYYPSVKIELQKDLNQ